MLALAGLEGEYLKVRADTRMLEEAVAGLRTGQWNGLNITMPLKSAAAKVSDSLSPTAARSGSVNTLGIVDGRVHGDSTDCTAFRELIADDRFRAATSVLVLGSGGTAAAALTAMPAEAHVYVSARRSSRAGELTGRHGGSVVSWGTPVAGALVVNTTPLGMGGEQLPNEILGSAAGLIDLPYGQVTTPAVAYAVANDLPYSDGHEFLLRQAIASFAIWTGVDTDLDALRSALRKV